MDATTPPAQIEHDYAHHIDGNTRQQSDLGRIHSNVSHVQIDHFNPAGVAELQQTLSRATHETGFSGVKLTGLGDGPFDLEKVLRHLMRRRNESDIKTRELGVVFRDLRVVGSGAAVNYQPTFGSLFDPRIMWEGVKSIRHPPTRDILSGFEGVVRPGEMLLVLGRPGSGCSTLLKTLANQRGEYHDVTGEVNYDSFTPKDIAQRYRGDVLYCPEDDLHFPSLTVDETLRFATKTRAPATRLPGYSRKRYVRTMTDALETIFGLRHAQNTPVGNNMIRGVSGGEKKRVSISEALAMRCLIGSWDNSTRGLDSSTALEFVRALRIATDVARLTTIVSIYQAGEQLYEHFDKVCVIYEGRMAYFGPANRARQYFIDLGYEPAHRQTTADFLVAVTDPNGRIPRGLSTVRPPPANAAEFADAFTHSELGRLNREDIEAYRSQFVGKPERVLAFKESARAERPKHSRQASPYTISIPMQTRAVMMRRVQIIKGNSIEQILQLAVFILQAIIMGTVFYKSPEATKAFFSRGGVLFFAVLFAALTTMAEIPALFSQRPMVERHSKAALYHPFIEALALTLVDIPMTFVTQLVFSVIIYFLVGLQKSASQFFIFFLFVFSVTVAMKAWFRMLAAAFKSAAPAQTVAGISILALGLYTGYTIPRPLMIGALRWITYINPLRYGFAAVLLNEFRTLDGECSGLIPQGPGYENVSLANQVCTTVGSLPGQATVSGARYVELSFGYKYSEIWRDFGVIIAFGVGFISFLLLFSELNTTLAGTTSVTLFRRGSQVAIRQRTERTETHDEEKGYDVSSAHGNASSSLAHQHDAPAVIPEHIKMQDVFSWQHIAYTVPVSGGQRKLLDDVSGYVVPGKLTALMGESGAGKTTLLNVLAERTGTGIISGDRYVNGQALPSDFQAQTGYCQQMDTHLGTATVREALLFSAKLRQPSSVPLAEKEAYVETCLKMCGLEAYADAIVGSLGVEHRKRTTIGVELAAKPKLLLFLDEPTSGLDSQSAWGVMTFLRSLADSGTAILCTIHQPSAELFQQFDRLLLLKKGGQTVYFGPLGERSSILIDYFQRNGARNIEPQENVAEYMLEVIGAGATATSEIEWHGKWVESEEALGVQKELEHIHEEGRSRPPVAATFQSEFATSWLYQVVTLLSRNATHYWRDPTYVMSKLALNICGGLFIGFTFWQSSNSQQGIQSKLFSLFMATILCVPIAQQLQVPFIHTRDIYEIRERPSRMYSWTALVAAQIIIELPWNILGSSMFFFCWYWTVGYETSRAGLTFVMLCLLFPIYYSTVGQAVAAMAPNAEIAALLFSFLFSFVVIFNGVLQPYRELGWWKWMYRLSPFSHLIAALLGQAIGHQELTCLDVEYVTINPPSGLNCGEYMGPFMSYAGGYLLDSGATSGCRFCSTRTTDQYLDGTFNIKYSDYPWHIGVFCAFIVFNVFATFALTWIFRIRTGSLVGSVKDLFKKRS